MSEFYTSIANYYDQIFPVGAEKVNFLMKNNPKTAIDIACATGEVMKALQDKGVKVTGIDLDDKFIEMAREKNLDARKLNMLYLDEIDEKFDLLYCIGNSIAHLKDYDEIREFLKKSYDRINSNGKIVIQFINFEKFLKNEDDQGYLGSLPDIKNDEFTFHRNYFKEEDDIRFNTTLVVNDLIIENNERLFPILKDEMVSIMWEVGFKNINVYGNFKGEEFDEKVSQPVIITGEVI